MLHSFHNLFPKTFLRLLFTLMLGVALSETPINAQVPPILHFESVQIGKSKEITFSRQPPHYPGRTIFYNYVTIVGQDADEFEIVSEDMTGHWEPTGTPHQITIRFTPKSRGPKSATFTGSGYFDNETNTGSTVNFIPTSLDGTGLHNDPFVSIVLPEDKIYIGDGSDISSVAYDLDSVPPHDAGQGIVSYQWNVDGADLPNPPLDQSINYKWDRPGDHTVSLTVTDAEGGMSTDKKTVTVASEDPTIDRISPNSMQASSNQGNGFNLLVFGHGFDTTSEIRFGPSFVSTTYLSPTQLTAHIDAVRYPDPSVYLVQVKNPFADKPISQGLFFMITGRPRITMNVIDSSKAAGTITITFTNFSLSNSAIIKVTSATFGQAAAGQTGGLLPIESTISTATISDYLFGSRLVGTTGGPIILHFDAKALATTTQVLNVQGTYSISYVDGVLYKVPSTFTQFYKVH